MGLSGASLGVSLGGLTLTNELILNSTYAPFRHPELATALAGSRRGGDFRIFPIADGDAEITAGLAGSR